MPRAMRVMSFNAPPALAHAIHVRAAERGQTVSEFIREALRAHGARPEELTTEAPNPNVTT